MGPIHDGRLRAASFAVLLATVAQSGVDPAYRAAARPASAPPSAAAAAAATMPGERDLVLSVLPDGVREVTRAPGRVVSVPVTLDLTGVSATGDLGSIQLDLTYDAALLEYVAAEPGVAGSAVANLVEPGRVRFAFAATEPQGRARIELFTLRLRVKDDAAPGRTAALGVSFAGRPSSTGFQVYQLPTTVAGRIVVAKH